MAKIHGIIMLCFPGQRVLGCSMAARVLQIHLNVSDMKRAIDFYTGALGLSLSRQPTAEWAELAAGNLEVGLLLTDHSPHYINRGDLGSRAGATVTFASDDIARDRARLLAAGAVIVKEDVHSWGHLLVFEDTEGNILRLMKE